MNKKEQRELALKAARDLADLVTTESRDFTDDERKAFDDHLAQADDLEKSIKAAAADQDRMSRIKTLRTDQENEGDAGAKPFHAKTLGEHFVHFAGSALSEIKGRSGASASAPEFKAAGDTHTVGTDSVFQGPVLTEYDRNFVREFQPRLVVADLFSSGAISGDKNAISYFVEGALEGAFTTVAEGGAKPQLHLANPTLVTDGLKKIAGFIKNSDEMVEDLSFMITEINNRLLDALRRFEEVQLLSGDGTGSNVLGLLNRDGIQTEAATADADNADAVFRAMTKISTGSGLDADAVVINPVDYQALRLQRDANEQYFGGGYFAGQYGNGGVPMQPPLWGLNTVVTPAITAGTALVGAFKQAGTVYRKGGVRVESTNSHASDFTSNLVTTRAEERIALALRYPAGVCVVTLGTPAAG